MMLLRRTFIYMPAQIMGPLAQFLAAAIWTYFLAPEAFGTYVLVWAIQELALLLVLSWWSAYALRYITSHNDDILRFDGVEIASSSLQQSCRHYSSPLRCLLFFMNCRG